MPWRYTLNHRYWYWRGAGSGKTSAAGGARGLAAAAGARQADAGKILFTRRLVARAAEEMDERIRERYIRKEITARIKRISPLLALLYILSSARQQKAPVVAGAGK